MGFKARGIKIIVMLFISHPSCIPRAPTLKQHDMLNFPYDKLWAWFPRWLGWIWKLWNMSCVPKIEIWLQRNLVSKILNSMNSLLGYLTSICPKYKNSPKFVNSAHIEENIKSVVKVARRNESQLPWIIKTIFWYLFVFLGSKRSNLS